MMKAVAFSLDGRQIAASSTRNRYTVRPDGAAIQSPVQTWSDCLQTLRGLAGQVEDLAARTAAIAVTGQGDGTWLVGQGDEPVSDAWLWLDARAAPTVHRLRGSPAERTRFEATGTGLSACQQGAQLAHLARHEPALLEHAEVALHCKDWLYLKLTGERTTDPSEAVFTYGDFRSRQYADPVIDALGLHEHRDLLPPITDGISVTHPLSAESAAACGLASGTPVCLGYVDMICTALGAGVHTGDESAACSIVGSTGVHMRSVPTDAVQLNEQGTGYVMALPLPGRVVQAQSNMAASLNIDWVLDVAADLLNDMGQPVSHADLVARIEPWLAGSRPGALVYHPYISEAGERGPFVDVQARAAFIGLDSAHRFPDLVRAVVEGLGMATRDCYSVMGELPGEIRLTGGAARSPALRGVLAASVNAAVRASKREETGAAGAAMIAAVAIGVYPDMDACIAEWVIPLLGTTEPPDTSLVTIYEKLFSDYRDARLALEPVWSSMANR